MTEDFGSGLLYTVVKPKRIADISSLLSWFRGSSGIRRRPALLHMCTNIMLYTFGGQNAKTVPKRKWNLRSYEAPIDWWSCRPTFMNGSHDETDFRHVIGLTLTVYLQVERHESHLPWLTQRLPSGYIRHPSPIHKRSYTVMGSKMRQSVHDSYWWTLISPFQDKKDKMTHQSYQYTCRLEKEQLFIVFFSNTTFCIKGLLRRLHWCVKLRYNMHFFSWNDAHQNPQHQNQSYGFGMPNKRSNTAANGQDISDKGHKIFSELQKGRKYSLITRWPFFENRRNLPHRSWALMRTLHKSAAYIYNKVNSCFTKSTLE